MPLSQDQRAMLRLLALREEGYEDIAALLGLSVDQVRVRVREALTELDGSGDGAGSPVATPSPRASAPTPSAPEPAEPAGEAAPPPAPEPKPRAAQRRPRRPRLSLPKDRRRLVELGGGVLVALLLVLFATGAVDLGGDEDSGSGETAQSEAANGVNGELTQAVLRPPGGGDAIGQAAFGRVGKGPVLQVQAEGLPQTPAGKSYTVWLYRSPKLALRVGSVKAPKGGVAAQFRIPVELLSYVAGGAFNQISVSRTDDGAYKAEIARAKRQKRLPAYSGETVLRGRIQGPLVSQ